ncbi:MAG: sigma 54-interacting transcriptional regulator [Clostridia bacterium]|nr:sigma 54-interacting transcriptional regulator [Clostridia bacterium]
MSKENAFEKKIERLEEELEIYKTAFEASYDGIHIVNKDGYTVDVNKACERIEGFSRKEILGKSMQDLVREGYFSESVVLKVLSKNEPVTIIQKAKNGKEVMATGTPIYKNGKIDKVVNNLRDISELNAIKKELIEKNKLTQKYHSEIELLRLEQLKMDDIIAQSSEMRNILSLALRIAKVDSTVLIQGESGVGKGVLSKFIHNNSKRKKGPFIKIDCGSIPETLLESELFGYEKGAFTGAGKEGKIGLVELADGGTLFLDEIGELPLNLQVKILRLIQDKVILRVGGKEPVSVDIRIIAATNKDISVMIENKEFRQDLYYRLNVIPILIPSLKERREDVQPLVLKAITEMNIKYNLSKKIDIEAMETLIHYHWPGNVRELENMMERLVVTIDEDTIRVKHLAATIKDNTNNDYGIGEVGNKTMKDLVGSFEKQLLEKTMEISNSTHEMAEILKIDQSTVRKKMKKLGIENRFK